MKRVDENFDVWLRHKKIDVTGISKPPPKDTTVFRDVILSCVAIIFYYYFLTSLILPAYFNFMMPVARHEPIVIARSDEVRRLGKFLAGFSQSR
ncbi:hypothetical protein OESDEN_06878 [Oesophagostomum dentatum]|uniref:Uncharacterized protein n=1 Tax=Oesophagostomum dentatum TaxID=61180 RepID=A0A0B1T7K9_OESDE|nr:hypothetical protein OESDEN_06878 [Oesophagostomum dentatum]